MGRVCLNQGVPDIVLSALVGHVYLSILSMDTDLLIFWDMYLICASQVSLLSRITPRNFVSVISVIDCPLAVMEMASSRILFVKSIKCVLFRLIISLLAANHSSIPLICSSIVFKATFKFSLLYVTVESSANCDRNSRAQQRTISLMYSRKRSGPSVEPCGTPMFTVFVSEFCPLICTKYFLSFTILSKNSKNLPRNP